MSNWALNGLFFIFLVIGYFMTSAAVQLLGYSSRNVGEYYALIAAILVWVVALASFLIAALETFEVISVSESGTWMVIALGILLFLMAVIAVLAIITAVMIQMSGHKGDLTKAFGDCIFSAFLSIGSIVLFAAILIFGARSATQDL